MEKEQEKMRAENVSFTINKKSQVHQYGLTYQQDLFITGILQSGTAPFIVFANSHEQEDIKNENSECSPNRSDLVEVSLGTPRKLKSLEELTKKFIDKFESSESRILAMDEITKEISAERRRVYDIINIMESLKVVSKIKKNLYQWNGFEEAIKIVRDYSNDEKGEIEDEEKSGENKVSLEMLSTNFLRFLISHPHTFTLDEACNGILGSEENDPKKTKVRRIYDIVNVFKCIGLVEKGKINRGKTKYLWLGLEGLEKMISERSKVVSQLLKTPLRTQEQYLNQETSEISPKHFENEKTKTVQRKIVRKARKMVRVSKVRYFDSSDSSNDEFKDANTSLQEKETIFGRESSNYKITRSHQKKTDLSGLTRVETETPEQNEMVNENLSAAENIYSYVNQFNKPIIPFCHPATVVLSIEDGHSQFCQYKNLIHHQDIKSLDDLINAFEKQIWGSSFNESSLSSSIEMFEESMYILERRA